LRGGKGREPFDRGTAAVALRNLAASNVENQAAIAQAEFAMIDVSFP